MPEDSVSKYKPPAFSLKEGHLLVRKVKFSQKTKGGIMTPPPQDGIGLTTLRNYGRRYFKYLMFRGTPCSLNL